jgi:hypothetical protein
VCDRCVVYGGQEDVEPYTTDSSPPYTTTLRAPSAAIIRTAGTFMPCVFLTPTTASLKLCVPSLSSRIASKPRHRAPARGREHHRSLGIASGGLRRRSERRDFDPRSNYWHRRLSLQAPRATGNALCGPRAPSGQLFGWLSLLAKAQRATTKTGTAPPRERSTAGDGGAALCARAPRATEKFPKGDYSYTRILAGGNSAEFQGARLDTATRARARGTLAHLAHFARLPLSPLAQAVLRHDRRQPFRPVGSRQQEQGRCRVDASTRWAACG